MNEQQEGHEDRDGCDKHSVTEKVSCYQIPIRYTVLTVYAVHGAPAIIKWQTMLSLSVRVHSFLLLFVFVVVIQELPWKAFSFTATSTTLLSPSGSSCLSTTSSSSCSSTTAVRSCTLLRDTTRRASFGEILGAALMPMSASSVASAVLPETYVANAATTSYGDEYPFRVSSGLLLWCVPRASSSSY